MYDATDSTDVAPRSLAWESKYQLHQRGISAFANIQCSIMHRLRGFFESNILIGQYRGSRESVATAHALLGSSDGRGVSEMYATVFG